MRLEEADTIGRVLAGLDDISPVLELGSSTLDFRTRAKPHIDALIHRPLRDRGVRIVHADIKDAEGVDVSGDIYSPEIQTKLQAVAPRCILCCNIFEHVTDRALFAQVCDRILAPGGSILVTVPNSYPYHPDPIDTYYRPTPADVALLFPGYSMILGEVINGGSYWQDLAKEGFWALPKAVAKTLLFVGPLPNWKSRAHRLLWLFRPYKMTLALLKKSA